MPNNSELETALDFAGKIPGLLRASNSDSLIEFTKPTRVEPIVLMDDRVVNLSFTHDILQTLSCIFSGYYLQAVSLAVNVGNVNVLELLDKVNPNRTLGSDIMSSKGSSIISTLTNSGLRSAFESAESYEYALPIPGKNIGLECFGLEAKKNKGKNSGSGSGSNTFDDRMRELEAQVASAHMDDVMSKREAEQVKKDFEKVKETVEKTSTPSKKDEVKFEKEIAKIEAKFPSSSGGGSRDAIKLAQDVSNLAVGKLLEVEVTSEGQTAKFPIQVRLITTTVPPKAMTHVLSIDSKDISLSERWHGWRSGQLKFIRDLVLCQDLVDEHREGLMKDATGIFNDTMKRRKGNKLSAIFSGEPSVATASNIVIIADDTRKELERNIGGKLSNFAFREKIFKSTYTMLLVVVDPEWEGITIYHRSISTPTELSAKDLKFAKGKNPDVAEILKAYSMGTAPSI